MGTMAIDYFVLVKRYYDMGLYTKDQVKIFVQAGHLTPEQYETITGEV